MKIICFFVGLLVKIAPMHFLIASVKAIGWDISVDTDEEFVQGLVIGTEDFVEKHTEEIGL